MQKNLRRCECWLQNPRPPWYEHAHRLDGSFLDPSLNHRQKRRNILKELYVHKKILFLTIFTIYTIFLKRGMIALVNTFDILSVVVVNSKLF